MADKTYSVIIGIGVAVLVFALLAGLNTLMTPVFAGAGSQIATATGTTANEAVVNATTAYSETNESSGIIFPLLPYIGIAGGLILIIFGKPISSLLGKGGF